MVTSIAALGGKPPIAPEGTPPERAAQADAERQTREQNFVTAFEASGRDPRSLPRTHLDATAKVSATLKESVSTAGVIVVGTAERSRFAPNPAGGLPIATTTIRIAEVVRRDATLATAAQTLDLYQAGGPVPYPTPGGSLRGAAACLHVHGARGGRRAGRALKLLAKIGDEGR